MVKGLSEVKSIGDEFFGYTSTILTPFASLETLSFTDMLVGKISYSVMMGTEKHSVISWTFTWRSVLNCGENYLTSFLI